MNLPAPDVEGYKGGNTSACYQQLLRVIAANSEGEGENQQAPRAFAFEIASKIGAEFCQHSSAPEPLANMSAELKKQAAARHPGLCGRHHAWVIAAIKTQDVEAKWGSTTGNKYRNQACFDGAVAMNARGEGIQLPRAECFTHACRALWPDYGEMEASVVQAFFL